MQKNLLLKIESYIYLILAVLGLGLLIYSWPAKIDDRRGQWAVILIANKSAVEIDKDVFFVDSNGTYTVKVKETRLEEFTAYSVTGHSVISTIQINCQTNAIRIIKQRAYSVDMLLKQSAEPDLISQGAVDSPSFKAHMFLCFTEQSDKLSDQQIDIFFDGRRKISPQV